MLVWSAIDTVFLDMDGTLLDLNFDNHFWQEHVPLRYAQLNHISVQDARHELLPLFQRREGTMQWYCLDYWTETLGMDIASLKHEVKGLIAIHPHVVHFLDRLHTLDKHVLLVTNAHRKSLALKMECTQLEGHFDALISTHDYGYPKEDPAFWPLMRTHWPHDPARSLLVDDSLPVLRTARDYGIAHLRGITRPDTCRPARGNNEFQCIDSFADIMPEDRTLNKREG